MATTIAKRKKFSLTTVFTLILSVLPGVLEILNDPDDSDIVSIGLISDPKSGNLKAQVLGSEKSRIPTSRAKEPSKPGQILIPER